MEITITSKDYPDIFCPVENGYIDKSYLYMFPKPYLLVSENNEHCAKDINKFKVIEGVTKYKVIFPQDENSSDEDKDQFIEIIKKYFFKKYTYREICELLKSNHNITITVRTIRRIYKELKLRRKNIVESRVEMILATIIKEAYDNGMNLGYRAMHQRLRTKYRLSVKQSTVLELLRRVDPQGVEERSRYRLKRRMYKVPGPNYLWHIDGYDKLKKFGFAIHGCIDGFSRKVLWLHVSSTNNNPKVIAYYYLNCIQNLDLLPAVIRSDKGTENTLIDLLQMGLRFHHTDEKAGEESFIKGKSTSNERIEKFWRQLRNHTAEFYINIFKTMHERKVLDIGDKLHIEVLRFVFGPLIQKSLVNAQKEWNEHRLRKQSNLNVPCGIPNVLYHWPEKYGRKDCSLAVDQRNVTALLNKYIVFPVIYDPKIKNLVELLIPNVSSPRNTEEAYNLFVKIIHLINT